MADTTILSGDVGVTWFDNNRCKYLEWIGGTNTNYTMNQLYSAMQTLQDEVTTIDDGTCFSAETPTEYTIGKIDQGDNDPWYITFDLMEHITGGALKTSGWARVEGTNTGVIMVPVTAAGNTIVAADAGNDISTSVDGDAGTLLEVIDTGSTNDYLIIRPDSNAAGNSFDNSPTSGGTINCNGNSATQAGASTTGDQVWANIYTIGTVEDTVHMYIYQGAALTTDARGRVYSWNDATKDWYGNGHIDTTCALYDITASTWTAIDSGYLNVYARKGGDLYANFEVSNSITSGGRNPVPLQTAVDLDQSHGTKKISTGAWAGTYQDGEIITGGTSNGRGIVDLTNSTTDSELVYFPIAESANGGAIVALQNTETITGTDSSATSTSSSIPADDGPADSAWFTGTGAPTVTMTAATADIDNDGTNEYYGVSIDCNQSRLSEVYQWCKYITQYGQGASGVIETAETGINGEEYIGGTVAITYTGGTTPANIAEGESVTQQNSNATGVVLSHDSTNMKVLLRSTRGTFNANTIDADDDSSTWTGVTASNFAAKTAAPLGTFAGGTFFGARGVVLTDYHADDTNLFILTDIDGNTKERPTSLTFTMTNLVGGAETSNEHDRISWLKLTGSGGNVDKNMFGGIGAVAAAGDATFTVANNIEYIPDSGTLIIQVDPGLSTAVEYTLRYSSHNGTGKTFTLANTTGTATAGTDTDTIVDSGASFTTTAKRGDLVYTSKGISYVLTVDDANTIQLTDAISGLTTSDAYELNAVPVALDTGDDMYVPYIHKVATSSSEAASFIDPTTQIFYRVKCRNSRNATTKIKPYSSDGNVTSANASVQVTRTEDTIIT